MEQRRNGTLLVSMVAVFLLSGGAVAEAQAVFDQRLGHSVGSIFGTIIQDEQRSEAQKSWEAVSSDTRTCLDVMYARYNTTTYGLIRSGVSANDQRLAPVINFCSVTTTRQLRTNFPCSVTNEAGQSVPSMCNEAFAQNINGTVIAINRDDYIHLAANGRKVLVSSFETPEAHEVRLQQEKLQADIARQQFLDSPEGKRQAALEAALERQKEAQEKEREKELNSFRPY